ncbi:hypothetical protein LTR05_002281 [Lithohypha guttulata]|uniref:DUF1776-domain-containing protein n=1 Tax=Lithohypha guttulata TaxID=1690604 RepID=A0AAN7YC33_9EURO|nr:hypothetical protein LTR05_002281 [Lithohypha guttulata]
MTSDDQQFLDLLASIPQDMASYGSRIADYIEKHSNAIAADLREAIDHASWLPESLKPPRGASHGFFAAPPPPPQGPYEKTVAFISKNRTAIAVVLAFAGTTAYLVHRRRRAHAKKRRAKKLPNGAKKEIVVLACSTFHDPLTRSLAVDLERRGYIVYVTVSSTEEDTLVHQEAKPDLRPIWIDVTSTVPNPAYDTHPDLDPIRELLSKSSRSISPSSPRVSLGSKPYEHSLAGIILFPGCSGYPVGPFALLHPSDVVDSVNTRLLQPLLTAQQFLPLLARHSYDSKAPTSIVIAYPSIPQALNPPAELTSTLVSTSLSALAASLRREITVSSANIVVSELKLGNFDLGSTYSRTFNRDIYPESGHEHSQALTHWHSSQRAAAQRSRFGQSKSTRGSSAREFHNAVFDALAPPSRYKAFNRWEWGFSKRSSVVFVGSGARVYDLCGKVLPSGLVSLMMGYRRRRDTCLLPGSVREKVEGDGLEDLETIGLVSTLDIATGQPVRRPRDEEEGLAGGFDERNAWREGSRAQSDTSSQGQISLQDHDLNPGAGESAMWEKV